MLGPFFRLAAASGRRRAFRTLMLAHVTGLALLLLGLHLTGETRVGLAVGNLVLIAGIVEGALLLGWRLTQIPKSQALEFILVSPLESTRFLLLEATVCVVRLLVVTAAGVPLLLWLTANGPLE